MGSSSRRWLQPAAYVARRSIQWALALTFAVGCSATVESSGINTNGNVNSNTEDNQPNLLSGDPEDSAWSGPVRAVFNEHPLESNGGKRPIVSVYVGKNVNCICETPHNESYIEIDLVGTNAGLETGSYEISSNWGEVKTATVSGGTASSCDGFGGTATALPESSVNVVSASEQSVTLHVHLVFGQGMDSKTLDGTFVALRCS